MLIDDDDGGGCGSEISEFVWSGLVWNKHVRKLVNESHGKIKGSGVWC